MPVDHTEKAFEDAIEHHLLNVAGYAKTDPTNFDCERALDPTVFIPFVKETQPQVWENLEKLHGTDAEGVVLDDLCRAMNSRGSLAVIRHGFKCFGKLIRVAFFAPAHGMNSDTERLYAANRLAPAAPSARPDHPSPPSAIGVLGIGASPVRAGHGCPARRPSRGVAAR